MAERGGDFLLEYWKRPIPLQNHSNKFSLYPEECGKCHKNQYESWRESLHSRAVGPGLLEQLDPAGDLEFVRSCYFCHAPMMEQSEVRSQKSGVGIERNKHFDNKLKLSGVSCSVCHLREGEVYGPQARKTVSSKKQDNHNGFIEKDFFEKAEFCAACHQLDEGYELNGKVLVNTYREWNESIYGQNNITCQNCHMPDRKHLFKGIHDPDMVKRAIGIETVPHKNGARLIITNAGAGHFFPTYTTPLVVVKGFILDRKGKTVFASLKTAFIGRKVNLDLTQEIFDTRIPPKKSFEFDYTISKSYNSNKLVFEVWVYPDEFYNRFYKNLLKNKGGSFNRKEIEKALKITEESGYILFKEVL